MHSLLCCTTGAAQAQLSSKSPGFRVKADESSNLSSTPQPDDVALLLHTSGTTSKPKAVPLNHGNLAASLINIAETYELQPKDRSLLVMPLFHVHGLMAGAPLGSCVGVTPREACRCPTKPAKQQIMHFTRRCQSLLLT